MKEFFGVKLLCPDEIMGEYFERGKYKTLSFSDMMYIFVNGNSLPKTFAKWHSLSPLYYWIDPTLIIPGHMDERFACNIK